MRTPRMWAGMNLTGWFRLLLRNQSALASSYKVPLVGISQAAVLHSFLGLAQRIIWSDRIRQVELEQDPLFVVGHWRTGTTWLHELFSLDDRHTFPTSYQCFTPNHFLLTEWIDRRFFASSFPDKRPMDNMPMGFDSPQEDEFALCNLGQPSPYLAIAFPNEPFDQKPYLDLKTLPLEKQERWKKTFVSFLKLVTLRRPGRVVLKSPTHTCRISLLLDLFPNAQFVHVVRNPYDVFPSTMNLWTKLYGLHGLHPPTFENLEEVVFDTFLHLYKKVDEIRPFLKPTQFCEVRYEDLVANTAGELERVYEQLDLGDFDTLQFRLNAYLESRKQFKPNRYDMAPRLETEISQRWRPVIERYGYPIR